MSTRLRWPLIGLGAVALLTLPGMTAEADLGAWRFVVRAEGNHAFREEYRFRSRRACEEQRAAIRQGVARVEVAHGGATMIGGLARRLRLGPCEAVRRAR